MDLISVAHRVPPPPPPFPACLPAGRPPAMQFIRCADAGTIPVAVGRGGSKHCEPKEFEEHDGAYAQEGVKWKVGGMWRCVGGHDVSRRVNHVEGIAFYRSLRKGGWLVQCEVRRQSQPPWLLPAHPPPPPPSHSLGVVKHCDFQVKSGQFRQKPGRLEEHGTPLSILAIPRCGSHSNRAVVRGTDAFGMLRSQKVQERGGDFATGLFRRGIFRVSNSCVPHNFQVPLSEMKSCPNFLYETIPLQKSPPPPLTPRMARSLVRGRSLHQADSGPFWGTFFQGIAQTCL